MTWILILVIFGSDGVTSTKVEFASQERCQSAGNAAKENLGASVNFICVQK